MREVYKLTSVEGAVILVALCEDCGCLVDYYSDHDCIELLRRKA